MRHIYSRSLSISVWHHGCSCRNIFILSFQLEVLTNSFTLLKSTAFQFVQKNATRIFDHKFLKLLIQSSFLKFLSIIKKINTPQRKKNFCESLVRREIKSHYTLFSSNKSCFRRMGVENREKQKKNYLHNHRVPFLDVDSLY